MGKYRMPGVIEGHCEVDLYFVLGIFQRAAVRLHKPKVCAWPGCDTNLCQDNIQRKKRFCFVHQLQDIDRKTDRMHGE